MKTEEEVKLMFNNYLNNHNILKKQLEESSEIDNINAFHRFEKNYQALRVIKEVLNYTGTKPFFNMKQHEILKRIETLNDQYTELENWYLNASELPKGKETETLDQLTQLRTEANQLVKQLK